METRDLTLSKLNDEIMKLENRLDYFNNLKNSLFLCTQPKSVDLSRDIVMSSPTNKMDQYVISLDEIERNEAITSKLLNCLKEYQKKELKRIGALDKELRDIIILRELKRKRWWEIALDLNYSEITCKRKYYDYKKMIQQ